MKIWPVGLALLFACDATSPAGPLGSLTSDNTGQLPLTQLLSPYLGHFEGGQYANGGNSPPPAWAQAGRAAGASVRPLDAQGRPLASGRAVVLAVGYSNTAVLWCGAQVIVGACLNGSVIAQAAADPAVRHTGLVLVNGGVGGVDIRRWANPLDTAYNTLADRVTAAGVDSLQVQVLILDIVDALPAISLPRGKADAYALVRAAGDAIRVLQAHYPNLRQIFLMPRTYGGYGLPFNGGPPLNPEPFAYESGFAAKWLVDAAITHNMTMAGNLSGVWIAWGPYLWADGTTPRADGLAWYATDFLATDGTHYTPAGYLKAGKKVISFFKNSDASRCWFVASHPAC